MKHFLISHPRYACSSPLSTFGVSKRLFIHCSVRRHARTHDTGNSNRDLYASLGVPRTATQDEIKKAFRRKVSKLHPDVNPSPEAASEFSSVKQAYEVLSDPQKRSMYDMTGSAQASDSFGSHSNPFASGANPFSQAGGTGGFPGGPFGDVKFSFSDFEEIFEKMTGKKPGGATSSPKAGSESRSRGGPEAGADVHFKLNLTFSEAIRGCTKEISYMVMKKCAPCRGTGSHGGEAKIKCSQCLGKGKISTSTGFFHVQQECPQCNGDGEIMRSVCQSCTGKGVLRERTTQQLPIPRGVDTHERLKVLGKGDCGVRSGPSGNLFVEVFVDDSPSLFTRRGANVHLIVPISLTTALLGGIVTIPTLTSEVDLRVNPGTQTGDCQILRGRGVSRPNKNQYGDLYLHYAVHLPRNLTLRQVELLKEFQSSEDDKMTGSSHSQPSNQQDSSPSSDSSAADTDQNEKQRSSHSMSLFQEYKKRFSGWFLKSFGKEQASATPEK